MLQKLRCDCPIFKVTDDDLSDMWRLWVCTQIWMHVYAYECKIYKMM